MSECRLMEELISAYVDDMLDEQSRENVESHIKSCDACQQMLHDFQTLSTFVSDEDIAPSNLTAMIHQHLESREECAGAEEILPLYADNDSEECVNSHIQSCHYCLTEVNSYKALHATISELEEELPPADLRERIASVTYARPVADVFWRRLALPLRWVTAASAAVLIAGAVWMSGMDTGQDMSATTQPSLQVPTAPGYDSQAVQPDSQTVASAISGEMMESEPVQAGAVRTNRPSRISVNASGWHSHDGQAEPVKVPGWDNLKDLSLPVPDLDLSAFNLESTDSESELEDVEHLVMDTEEMPATETRPRPMVVASADPQDLIDRASQSEALNVQLRERIQERNRQFRYDQSMSDDPRYRGVAVKFFEARF